MKNILAIAIASSLFAGTATAGDLSFNKYSGSFKGEVAGDSFKEESDGVGITYSQDAAVGEFGFIGSFHYSNGASQSIDHKSINLMAGGLYKVTSWVGVYAQAGVSRTKLKHTTYTTETISMPLPLELTGGVEKEIEIERRHAHSKSDTSTDLIYGVGIRLTPTEMFVIDAGLQKSKPVLFGKEMDNTNFNIGFGFRF